MKQEQSLWEKTQKKHLRIIHAQAREPVPKTVHLTKNRKTGVSIDVPPHVTCTPTAVCAGSSDPDAPCYALRGFQSFPNAIRAQARNQRLMDHLRDAPYSEVCRVADDLWGALPRDRNWLRWNGAGDLTDGAVRLINTFTRRHSDITVWVITRKPAQVEKLKDRKNLRVLMSLDYFTPKGNAERLRELQKKFVLGAARLSYTRTSERDTPPEDAWVVFNKHVGAYYNDWEHPNVCPSSLPGTEHIDACDDCRRCFK